MSFLKSLLLFLIVVFLQVTLFNNFLFFGYMNPYIYVYWLLAKNNEDQRSVFLLLAFSLGACIDIFEGSGGMHAFSTTFLAFIQPYIWRLVQNQSEENEDAPWLEQLSIQRKLLFLLIAIFIHHFILFTTENFGFNNLGILVQRSLYSSIFSFTFVGLYQIWKARR